MHSSKSFEVLFYTFRSLIRLYLALVYGVNRGTILSVIPHPHMIISDRTFIQ